MASSTRGPSILKVLLVLGLLIGVLGASQRNPGLTCEVPQPRE